MIFCITDLHYLLRLLETSWWVSFAEEKIWHPVSPSSSFLQLLFPPWLQLCFSLPFPLFEVTYIYIRMSVCLCIATLLEFGKQWVFCFQFLIKKLFFKCFSAKQNIPSTILLRTQKYITSGFSVELRTLAGRWIPQSVFRYLRALRILFGIFLCSLNFNSKN